MSDYPNTPNWWQASDGKWYPPEAQSDRQPGLQETGNNPWWQKPWVIGLGVLVALAIVGALVIPGGEEADDNDAIVSSQESDDADPAEPASEPCSYAGINNLDDMQVLLQFENPFTSQLDLTVTYGLDDSAGTRFATARHFVPSAFPGELLRVVDGASQELPKGLEGETGITCEILTIENLSVDDAPLRPSPGDDCVVVGTDNFGDLQVELTVTSPYADQVDLYIEFSLTVDGVRFDDGMGPMPEVAPGETVTFSADSLRELPAWANGTPSCQILAIDEF